MEAITLPTLRISTVTNPPEDPAPKVPRIPAPSHRHAAPSAPWPWMDLGSEVDSAQTPTRIVQACKYHGPDCKAQECWTGYPQSLFPNWTPDQQGRSGIADAINPKSLRYREKCRIYRLDMMENALFYAREGLEIGADKQSKEKAWAILRQRRPAGTRVRVLFVDSLSGTALQMLGARYKIEPFFFSSSLKWIPSRFQEEVRPGHGDHITFCLIFISTKTRLSASSSAPPSPATTAIASQQLPDQEFPEEKQVIDIQEPLPVRSSDHILFQDLLAVHMVRSNSGSTLVSYHSPQSRWYGTQAKALFERIHFAGRSVYWQNIFTNARDPTCLILSFLWHAAYSWDEAQEVLYKHICHLESSVMNTNDMQMTQELHVVRAHILHYESLLDDFRKTVQFIKNTPNPAMAGTSTSSSSSSLVNDPSEAQAARMSKKLLHEECDHLLSEIERLKETLDMHDKRLKNVMQLTFSLVNIEDSRRMAQLAEASGKDSAAMRQISSLTMVFLPASLVSAVFGMNVVEINSGSIPRLWLYLAIAFPLTFATIWVVVAFQFRNQIVARREGKKGNLLYSTGSHGEGIPWWEDDEELSAWSGLWWPVLVVKAWMKRKREIGRKKTDGLISR